MHNLPRYNEYFVLSLAVSKNDMMIQLNGSDKSNTTPIGQDRETSKLCFTKCSCSLFCVVYIPLFSLVQLGYPRYNEYFCC